MRKLVASLLPLVAAVIGTSGCTSKPIHAGHRAAMRVAEGAKVEPIRGKGGQLEGLSISREKGGGGTMSCGCSIGACQQRAGSPCRLNQIDHTGWSEAWCDGGCFNSEGNDCGGCSFIQSGGGSGSGGSGGTGHGRDIILTFEADAVLTWSTSASNPNPIGGKGSDDRRQ